MVVMMALAVGIVALVVIIQVFLHVGQFFGQGILLFHRGQNLLAVQLGHGGGDHGGGGVVFADQGHAIVDLLLGRDVCAAEDDGRG